MVPRRPRRNRSSIVATLKPDAHINTVGPKFDRAHEVTAELAERSDRIVSDSPQQISAQGPNYLLAQSPALARVEHLGRVDQHVQSSGHTLFVSAGLAGTEVLVADQLLRAARLDCGAASNTP